MFVVRFLGELSRRLLTSLLGRNKNLTRNKYRYSNHNPPQIAYAEKMFESIKNGKWLIFIAYFAKGSEKK